MSKINTIHFPILSNVSCRSQPQQHTPIKQLQTPGVEIIRIIQ